jgi:GNAT superfamily N-acetyltransferase
LTLDLREPNLRLAQRMPPKGRIRHRLATANDRCAVGQVAAQAFKGYFSHFHSDRRLRREDADAVYCEWAERSCVSRDVANAVILAEEDEQILGFGTIRESAPGSVDNALFGVLPAAQGRGVFRSLISEATAWALAREYQLASYSTQIQNKTVLNAVLRSGFEYDRACYTFHRWWD